MPDNKLYKFVPLPPGFAPTDATIDQVCAFRLESRSTVHKKMREGAYVFYKDGKITKIIFSSVLADRERSIAHQKPIVPRQKASEAQDGRESAGLTEQTLPQRSSPRGPLRGSGAAFSIATKRNGGRLRMRLSHQSIKFQSYPEKDFPNGTIPRRGARAPRSDRPDSAHDGCCGQGRRRRRRVPADARCTTGLQHPPRCVASGEVDFRPTYHVISDNPETIRRARAIVQHVGGVVASIDMDGVTTSIRFDPPKAKGGLL